MKRLGVILALLPLTLLAGPTTLDASPLDEVIRSRHNLALPSLPPSTSCTICHIDSIPGAAAAPQAVAPEAEAIPPPHQAPTPPLWSNTGGSYRLTATLSAKRHPYNQPTGSSLTCLACHDGALAKDMHGVNVRDARIGAEANVSWEGGFSQREAPPLSRVDHPISIPYPRKPNGMFVPENPSVTYARYWTIPDLRPEGYVLPEEGTSSYLDLPQEKVSSPEILSNLVRTTSGRVECDSCHNPHSEKIRPFLRVPSASLCLVCHDR
jgi:predicted CXXCH cytochrome family protein